MTKSINQFSVLSAYFLFESALGFGASNYGPCGKISDMSQVVEVSGRIASIEESNICEGQAPLQTLMLKDSNDLSLPFAVTLAPDDFLFSRKMNFAVGSDVTIKGVHSDVDGRDYLTATAVTMKDRTLKLRDSSGKPLWKVKKAPMANVSR